MAGNGRVCLIVNPVAGRMAELFRGPVQPDEVRLALERHGVMAEMRLTERPGHATELAREATRAGAELVVAAGGDGTVREVARALIATRTKLGLLPLGSMMNVARALHIPRDLDQAAAVIRTGRTIQMDAGKAVARAAETLFLEMAGVGVDAGVFAYSNQLVAGKWGSLWKLLRFLVRYVPHRARLTVDGHAQVVRAFMINVAIIPFTGLGFALAPDARVDDRQFDVVIWEGFSRLEFLTHALSIAGGRRAYHPKARTVRARRVEVEPVRHRLMVHADDQLLGLTPARFELIPAALSVIVGEAPPGEPSAIASRPSPH